MIWRKMMNMQLSFQKTVMFLISDQLLAALLNLAGGSNSEHNAHLYIPILQRPDTTNSPTYN
jgi:hypothetical protein